MKRDGDRARYLRYGGAPWRGAASLFSSLHLTWNSIVYNLIIKPRSTFSYTNFSLPFFTSGNRQRYLEQCINIFVRFESIFESRCYTRNLPCTLSEKSNKTTELPLFAIQVGYIIALYLYSWLFSHSITRVCSNLNGLVLSIDKRLLYKGARQ